jgi:monofunctional biosynthetic peptidoglycan transglycosylase
MIKKIFKFLLKILAGFFLLTILMVIVYKWVPVPATPLMAIRFFENPGEDIRHDWEPIENISGHLPLAVVASEDQNFMRHSGFDIQAIEKAMEENRRGRRVRGASTISQQTAKNVFLWPQRSWFRKGMEVYFTYLIELFWSKERIMEVYLNSIEMGKGVYGAEAAAQYWFKKPASKLSRQEAATIAAVLPSPRRYSANPPGNYVQTRRQWILRQMNNLGPLNFE